MATDLPQGQRSWVSPSTIRRAPRRNRHSSGQHRPVHAHPLAANRLRRSHPLKLPTDLVLRTKSPPGYWERWSPSRSSGRCVQRTSHDPAHRPRAPVGSRDHRHDHTRQFRAVQGIASQPMLWGRRPRSHSRRPIRSWALEADLIVGPHNRSAIGTLWSDRPRSVKLLAISANRSIGLHAAP